MKSVKLITDGSCLGNPGPGGWAAILRFGQHEKELSGGDDWTTNNRMEMTAVVEGFKALTEPCKVTVELDSEYVRNGITKWIHRWSQRGWKTANGSPVKNRDLWLQIQAATTSHDVHWVWVKGHANHADNNRCDDLARTAAKKHSRRGRRLKRPR